MGDQQAKCKKCSKFSNCTVSVDLDGPCPGATVEPRQVGNYNLVDLPSTSVNVDASSSLPKVTVNRENTPILHTKCNASSIKKYSELCSCHESQGQCKCSSNNHTFFERFLPRTAPYWPRLKFSCLVIAGALPFIFLIIYLVLHNI